MKIIIIGAGIGGLATANLLARDGHEVHVFEKNDWLGGRAGIKRHKGFTFDTGPSWYLMPDVFGRYYKQLGVSVDDEIELMRLSPAYKVFFEHNDPVTIMSNLSVDADTFESIEPGSGRALKKYVEEGNKIYQLSLSHFLYSNFSSAKDIVNIQLDQIVPLRGRGIAQPHSLFLRFSYFLL